MPCMGRDFPPAEFPCSLPTMMDGASPIPLSSCGEKERQWHIASTFAKLIGLPLASAFVEQTPTESTAADEDDARPQSEMEEMQQLRVHVHTADLEKCSAQKRMASLHFAVREDQSLLERQASLHSEKDRQHFWNSIEEGIKKRDFSGFSFTEEEFDKYFQEECVRRRRGAFPQRERLTQLEERREEQLNRFIGECTEKLGIFDWSALSVSPTIEPRVDGLAMQGPNRIWVTAEVRQPATSAGFARDFVLVVDLSGSMCDVMDLLKDCLQDIVSRARNDDRVCVIGFSCQPRLLCDWTIMADQDSRSHVRDAVDGMASHGGTHLVPAFEMVQEQFSRLQQFPTQAAAPQASMLQMMPCHGGKFNASSAAASQPPPPRVPVVVLLSDGDPEEPVEAVYTSACRALDAAPGGKASLLSLSLGDNSNPALMALTAQCGGGPSLYIAKQNQLPEQLGRMWGYLGTLVQPRDLFLMLKPVGGCQIIQVERPLGGSAKLRSEAGQQFVIMSCGSAVAGSVQRFASQLQLPRRLSAGIINEHALNEPLLHMTWVWRQGLDGAVEMTTSDLRAAQVPSLLIEAKLGLPVRVTIDTEWGAGLDSVKFLGALAQALQLPADRLILDRLSPGSIIVDLQIMDVTPAEFQVVKAACKSPTEMPTDACAAVSAQGFPIKAFSLPGGSTFQRVLQWRLAQALEDVAHKGNTGRLQQVHHLASSDLAMQLDPEGKSARVAADASTALSQAPPASQAVSHSLLQQAYAHCQQLCPELEPGAASVDTYELQALRASAATFTASVEQRAAPSQSPSEAIVEFVAHEQNNFEEGVLSVRLRAEGEGAITVTAFRVELRPVTDFQASIKHNEVVSGDFMLNSSGSDMLMQEADTAEQTLTEDVPVAVGDVINGVMHSFGGFPAGMSLQLRAATFTSSGKMGPWSTPVMGMASVAPAPVPVVDGTNQISAAGIPEAAPEPVALNPASNQTAPLPKAERPSSRAVKSPAVSRRQSSRRSTSTISGSEIRVIKAEAQPRRFSLSWDVSSEVKLEPGKRWVVTATPLTRGGPVRVEVGDMSAEVTGLAASKGYRFCVEAAPERPQACSFGCVTGSSISRGVSYRAAEGIVLIPPFNEALHKTYSDDPLLEEISDGVFLSLLGPKA